MLLNTTLNNISQLVAEHPSLGFGDRLELLKQERHYLLDYMRRGIRDEHRNDIYDDLLRRAAVLLADICKAVLISENHYLASLQKENAADGVSAQQLIDQLNDESLTAEQHIRVLNRVFSVILLQPSWRESDSRLWLSYLISDTTAEFDACAVVCAIMMSGYLSFSYEKFRTLVILYQMVASEEVRQRALIGWIVCYDRSQHVFLDRQNELLRHLIEDKPDAAEECVKALMQMTNCALTDKDTKEFQQNLAPRLYKAQMQQLSDMDNTLGGSSIDEILNPSKTEQEMADLEADIKKLGDIQKKGVDLFFDGFSHMKRYPFFYKIVNWFVPFDKSHPDIQEVYQKLGNMKFLEHSMAAGPFCSSDKYSFVFAFSHVVNQLPEKLLQMMNDGEVAMIGSEMQREGMQKSPTYVRRMYLQDLYRFFNLFPQYKFRNVFGDELMRIDLIVSELSQYDSQVFADYGRFLLRRNETQRLTNLLSNNDCDGSKYGLLSALLCMKKGDYDAAYDMLKEVYTTDQSITVTKNYALSAFNSSHYTVAAQLYHELKSSNPDNISYALHYIMSEAKCGRCDVVLNDIYRLEYENEDNMTVRRVLAWVLLLAHQPEKADGVLQKILNSEVSASTPADYLNASYAKWFVGDTAMLIHYLVQYKRMVGDDIEKVLQALHEDADLLRLYNITEQQIDLAVDALV